MLRSSGSRSPGYSWTTVSCWLHAGIRTSERLGLADFGTVRPITRCDDPVLHHPCRPVTLFDRALRDLVADLLAAMSAADGVGLASPQIGVDLAMFVYYCPDLDGGRPRVPPSAFRARRYRSL